MTALWRHPIKSHGREALERVTLTKGLTMPWDRTWAVTHEATKFDHDVPAWAHCRNFVIGARTPSVAGIWAQLDEATRHVTLRHADLDDLTFCPDDNADIPRFLAWVAPLCPEHSACPSNIVSAGERGMTDSPFPSVSIMNTASHAAVADALGSDIDIARWRGNIWLDGLPAWAEFDWLGRDIRIGSSVLRVHERIRRCALTNTNTVTGLRDTDTLGVLNRVFGHQDFGVYAEVIESGDISIDASAELV